MILSQFMINTFTQSNTIVSESSIKTIIKGSRSINNIFWALIVTLGGLGFFLTGLASFFHTRLFFNELSADIAFLPQGITLLFYGTVGLTLGIFLFFTAWWDVGSGYNEYSKGKQEILVYRKSFPGKNSEISLKFNFQDIKSIKMRIKEGLNPKRQLLLCLDDKREIPLTGAEQPMALEKIESDAIKIAKYLNVFLETE